MLQIKRWLDMLRGKSVWHVNQDIGKCFAKDEIRGYYNNLTEKVTMMPDLLETDGLPRLPLGDGKFTDFPVAIFQYGLGAYDLYLQTQDSRYRVKFLQCVKWAVAHQDKKGRWDNFSHYYPEHPYGAMAQGEGASLLIRAFKDTGEAKYLYKAKTAIDFMLLSTEEGGTTSYSGEDIILLEYPHRKAVLNGWIFAWWGLYDYSLVANNKDYYKEVKERSLSTLKKMMPQFTCKYWSIYDLENRMASPFYHNLHIAQMQAMYELTGEEFFDEYASRWGRQQKNPICKTMAFVKKAIQKILEKKV